ncbi:MAG: hypothetical protein M3336_07335, partial [Chloroflexota bacterium]|nr:hypothetical protein [Chloroflexota bacterium]
MSRPQPSAMAIHHLASATNEVVVDGTPTLNCNVLQIDFNKDEFDRRRRDPEDIDGVNADPAVPFVF